ncbi:MAG TPA: signal peptidase I [Myxococcaceae bacterium]|nr:signal peptidase I [Myxococcaceae bacterium]
MATTAKAREKLEAEISARRTLEQRRASRRLSIRETMSSLWAPITFFGLALVFYIVLVEVHTASYTWAQPALKGLGLAAVLWFAGLLVWRLAVVGPKHLRRLRRDARELCRELEVLLRQHGTQLEPKVRERLVEQAAAVDTYRIAGNADRLEPELKKLSDLMDKNLAAWRRNSTLDLVIGFAKALAIALLIRGVIIEPFKIPSGSMIPTLEIGDQIFVNKFIYGVRIPWVNRVPFVISRLPQRGDVIVFNNPVDESKDFIKRVIGIPGDEVKIVDEVVYINGVPQPRKLLDPNHLIHQEINGYWTDETVALYEENLDGHPHHTLQRTSHPKGHVTEGPFHVPPGRLFVMGDNRDNSADSRIGFGVTNRLEFVPYGNIKGKAMVIWLSLSYDGLLSSLFGGTGLRTDRLFLPVR